MLCGYHGWEYSDYGRLDVMPSRLEDRYWPTRRQIPEDRIWELRKIYEPDGAKRGPLYSYSEYHSLSSPSLLHFLLFCLLAARDSVLRCPPLRVISETYDVRRSSWRRIAKHPQVISPFFKLKMGLCFYSELQKLPASKMNSLQLLKLNFHFKCILLSIYSRRRNRRLIIRCITDMRTV